MKPRAAGGGAGQKMNKPKLIPLEVFPLEENGERFMCLRDPLFNESNQIILSELAYYLITYFDGKTTVEEIIDTIKTNYGMQIDMAEFVELIEQLDGAYLLDNENYRLNAKKIEDAFNNSEIREPHLSNLSYPGNREQLETMLDNFYKEAEGDGKKAGKGELKGIISPHIDFNRGGLSYARAYRELIKQADADTYIIFGTTHYASNNNPFIFTKKSFSTPFGIAETDMEFIDKMEAECNWDLYEGEIFHRNEHSIEFQVVFLQHLLKDRKAFRIVPVLCNSFHDYIQSGVSPNNNERINGFLNSMKRLISDHPRSVFIIAGVDMAHVGPKFGDTQPVNLDKKLLIEQRDKESLYYTEKIDAEGFYRSVADENDRRKICGLSSIYSLLNVIDASYGKVLDYDMAIETDSGSVVTFASAAFYK